MNRFASILVSIQQRLIKDLIIVIITSVNVLWFFIIIYFSSSWVKRKDYILNFYVSMHDIIGMQIVKCLKDLSHSCCSIFFIEFLFFFEEKIQMLTIWNVSILGINYMKDFTLKLCKYFWPLCIRQVSLWYSDVSILFLYFWITSLLTHFSKV